jgi:hypothetical protein
LGFKQRGEKIIMQQLDYIDSEGGPLLFVDAELGNFWNGVDGNDYDRACHFFDSDSSIEGGQISIHNGKGILWEMNGAGTAYIFKSPDENFVILRGWFTDDSDNGAPILMAKEPIVDCVKLGVLNLSSGRLAILSSVENGVCILPNDLKKSGRPSGEMANDSAGYIIKLQNAHFELLHDCVESSLGVARRCHIKRIVSAV